MIWKNFIINNPQETNFYDFFHFSQEEQKAFGENNLLKFEYEVYLQFHNFPKWTSNSFGKKTFFFFNEESFLCPPFPKRAEKSYEKKGFFLTFQRVHHLVEILFSLSFCSSLAKENIEEFWQVRSFLRRRLFNYSHGAVQSLGLGKNFFWFKTLNWNCHLCCVR
jgi:hypothetical protein